MGLIFKLFLHVQCMCYLFKVSLNSLALLLCLQLKVSGNNLINICKLVFKVSRDEKNDVCFLEDNILGKLCYNS